MFKTLIRVCYILSMEELQIIKSTLLWHSLQEVWRGAALKCEERHRVNAFKMRCRRQRWGFEMLADGESIRIFKQREAA